MFFKGLMLAKGNKDERMNLNRGPSDKWFREFFKRHPQIKHCRSGAASVQKPDESTPKHEFNSFVRKCTSGFSKEMLVMQVCNKGRLKSEIDRREFDPI